MKLTLMSDLHLEFWEDPSRFIDDIVDNTPNSDLIALAGDIGVLAVNLDDIRNLLVKLSGKGRVLFIPGNHEYYGRHFDCGDEDLNSLRREMNAYKNIHVNTGAPEWVKVGDFNILAGTMWFGDGMYTALEKSWLSDFKVKGLEQYIYHYNTYFKNMLEQSCRPNIITISHHSPTYQSVGPRYKGSSLNKFFCNNFDSLLEKVTLACHGHLHGAVDYKIGNTRILSNPAGYPTEIPRDYKPLTIEV